jgi:hypothetical protein
MKSFSIKYTSHSKIYFNKYIAHITVKNRKVKNLFCRNKKESGVTKP